VEREDVSEPSADGAQAGLCGASPVDARLGTLALGQFAPACLVAGRLARTVPPDSRMGGLPGISAQELRRLYGEQRAALCSHCGRILGDSPSAEDAVHEVFLRVARWRGHLPEGSELRPWLFRIATNHCLNELRRRAMRARVPLVAAEAHPENTLAARSDLRTFLARLPERVCAVAWLSYAQGMLQQEVADTLGVSRRTVVSDLNQIRSRCLSDHGRPAKARRAAGRV
jgi:RNA polymerase sigma-70 factor, ECF subfamily